MLSDARRTKCWSEDKGVREMTCGIESAGEVVLRLISIV